MRKYLFFLFCSFFVPLSTAGTIDPKTPDHKYIEYGQKYECVVGLCGEYEDGSHYCASAVIIKPKWILTAAHVINRSKRCAIRLNGQQRNISKIICHQDFKANNFGYYDIAIGYSDEPLDIKVYPKLYNEKDEIGKVCAMVGFGITGTFDTGGVISDSKKRGGSNIIDKVDRDLLICSPSKTRQNTTQLEFLISSGDSGGGLFIDGRLAGINSCVMATDGKPDSTYSDESGHTRIVKYIDWIENNTNHDK